MQTPGRHKYYGRVVSQGSMSSGGSSGSSSGSPGGIFRSSPKMNRQRSVSERNPYKYPPATPGYFGESFNGSPKKNSNECDTLTRAGSRTASRAASRNASRSASRCGNISSNSSSTSSFPLAESTNSFVAANLPFLPPPAVGTSKLSISRSTSRSSSRLSLSSYSTCSRLSSNTIYTDAQPSTSNRNIASKRKRIQVSIRPKPMTENVSIPWAIDYDNAVIENADLCNFSYDYIFNPNESNENKVYEVVAAPVITECLKGYNGIIFAYGMTGSGKTHSMRGLVRRSVNELFNNFEKAGEREVLSKLDDFIDDGERTFISQDYGKKIEYMTCSVLEIYNEKIKDLLPLDNIDAHKRINCNLKIVDDSKFGVKVLGLNEIQISELDQLLEMIDFGEKMRSIDSTDYNYRSSRSHFIIMLKLFLVDGEGNKSVSVLNFCDLAGSERVTSHSDRRKEGSYINKSLLALGTVITKLSENKEAHIPYRDSKLTRLLQPSLNGDSVVSVLCTIQLGSSVVGETTNTLRFGARAKNILLNLKKSLDEPGDIDVNKLLEENARLQMENKELRRLACGNAELQQTQTGGDDINDNINDTYMNHIRNSTGDNKDEVYYELVAENNILNEQVEHLKRLQMEDNIIRARDSNFVLDKLYELVNRLILDPASRQETENLMNKMDYNLQEYDIKFKEIESYVGHLENRIRSSEIELARYKHQPVPTSAPGTLATRSDTGNTAEGELLRELQEELADMQQSMARKDAMIRALQRLE